MYKSIFLSLYISEKYFPILDAVGQTWLSYLLLFPYIIDERKEIIYGIR